MSYVTAPRTRPGRAGLLAFLVALLGALASLVAPSPAAAGTGLEQTVGTISAVDKALLPTTAKLYAAYTLASTPNSCPSGALSCVDRTITTMQSRFDTLAPTCNHNAVFSLLYLRVTEQYKKVTTTPGFFIRPALVNIEDTVFSDLYSAAYNQWAGGKPGSVPPSWRLAFAAAADRRVNGTGDALLGMVAHIRRDLPFALERIAMGEHADHLAINTMLKQVYPDAVVELGRRFDPTINPSGLYVPGTDQLVVDAIATWRDQAWQDAQALLAAPTAADRQQVALGVERQAWDTGLSLYKATLNTDTQTQLRDAYCATH